MADRKTLEKQHTNVSEESGARRGTGRNREARRFHIGHIVFSRSARVSFRRDPCDQ
jgi:hypothetical protein